MIAVTLDQKLLAYTQKRLGKMKSEAPKAMKNALNQTAKQARKELHQEAQKTYTVKAGGFNKAMRIKGATVSTLEAEIIAKGKPIALSKFRVSRAGGVVRAQVLKAGGLKTLEKGGIKAFSAKFGSGHGAIAQRRGRERLPIKELMSNSIPVMIGNEKRVFGVVKPNINKNLKTNLNKQIRRILEG